MIDISTLPVFISVKQAAVLLGFSRATTYRMAETDVLPVRRIGGRIYVETAGLPAFVKTVGLDADTEADTSSTKEDHAA
jgi:excisionase family DNA binding protein